MWFQDVISKAYQYALGQAGAAYVMQVDPQGVPLVCNGGAVNTFETAAMGYDPSTGRTPVEATNNIYSKVNQTSDVSESIKSAPGFVHSISCSAIWTGTATGPTSLSISLCDATSNTNIVLVKRVPATTAFGNTYATFDLVLDGIFASGIWINVTITTGTGATISRCDTTVTYR